MAPPPAARTEHQQCLATVNATLILLSRFTSALGTSETNYVADISVLDLLAKSATLIKAHTTKLSLLMINKPFTPSAIRKIVDTMSSEALTGMASGVQLCDPPHHTQLLHDEVKQRVRRVYRELQALMQEMLVLLETMEKEDKEVVGRDTLASTGVLWEACDAVIELGKLGLAGLVVVKAQQYRNLLEDAISELKEWVEGDEEEDDEDEEDDADSFEGSEDEADDIGKLLSAGGSLPKSRPDLRETAELAQKTLRLTSTLYLAVNKRRLKGLPVLAMPEIARLDTAMNELKIIPEEVDELVSACYDLDNDQARARIKAVIEHGKLITTHLRKSWKDQDDEFTAWSTRWEEAVDKE